MAFWVFTFLQLPREEGLGSWISHLLGCYGFEFLVSLLMFGPVAFRKVFTEVSDDWPKLAFLLCFFPFIKRQVSSDSLHEVS